MAILVTNIKIGLEESDDVAFYKAISKLSVSNDKVKSISIYKRSLDARKQNNIMFVTSVLVNLDCDEALVVKKLKDNNVTYKPAYELKLKTGTEKLNSPIVIAGFGPAGIFCGYILAKLGYKPIIIERGKDVDSRVEAVETFFKERTLNSECNVQFGEGGAGTFSDGKLTTRINDERCNFVIDTFFKFGAPKEILTSAKPHIGTDKLRRVIKNIRKEIIALGGEVLFSHKLENIVVKNSRVQSVIVNNKEIRTENLVLAVGHSARDTFEMLLDKGVFIEPKSFSVGVRIEHLQSEIDKALYGKLASHPNLPKGEYQLSYREAGRGVYTFCMCPGGTVVPAASEEESVVTNGMSEYKRDKLNANSALVVSVGADDYGKGVLDGMYFQRHLEKTAFNLGGMDYCAPAVTVGDFLKGKAELNLKSVEPSYSLGVKACDFDKLFPAVVNDFLKKGLLNFDKKIKGFACDDAVMTGVETRTSSPVRITRSDDFNALGINGLYPCGEGAGYAGGIVSAAVDGIKVAQSIALRYRPVE